MPGFGGPPPRGGSKTGLFVVLALLVVVAVGGGIFLLTSSDSDGGSGGGGGGADDPVAALQAFYQAALDNDCTAGVDLITESSWAYMAASDDFSGDPADLPQIGRDEAIAACESNIDDSETEKLTNSELASQSGSTAIVTATIQPPGADEYTTDYHMAQEGGGWKVDLAATVEAYMSDLGG